MYDIIFRMVAFTNIKVAGECKKFGVPLWQCPHFLFVVMGILIIGSIVSSYVIGSKIIDDIFLVNMLIMSLTTVLFIISFIITHSFERLAEANRLKSEFVSIVSHQLRAPLTNFIWALDFLNGIVDKKTTQEEQEYFQILDANASRMKDLVNELLTVSRIQEGRIPLFKKEFSFPQLIESIVSEFDPAIKAANIKLRVEGDAEITTIYNDPSRIRSVVTNFLDNAIKYTKKALDEKNRKQEQGTVTIHYKKQGGNDVYISVTDNGIGIPDEDKKFLFSKFFRSSNVLKHETQGSGLGLYIAKSIIEKAGGRIGFESQLNKGSTFWVTIPIQ